MKILTLHRTYFPRGTFSYLCDDNGNIICVTCERAWTNNKPGVSCVPEGIYDLVPHTSPKHGKCYALEAPTLGVEIYGPSLRTHILFHKANKPSQLEGCIAPGRTIGVLDNEPAVLSSGDAFDELMRYLGGEPAKLVIRRA